MKLLIAGCEMFQICWNQTGIGKQSLPIANCPLPSAQGYLESELFWAFGGFLVRIAMTELKPVNEDGKEKDYQTFEGGDTSDGKHLLGE